MECWLGIFLMCNFFVFFFFFKIKTDYTNRGKGQYKSETTEERWLNVSQNKQNI